MVFSKYVVHSRLAFDSDGERSSSKPVVVNRWSAGNFDVPQKNSIIVCYFIDFPAGGRLDRIDLHSKVAPKSHQKRLIRQRSN